jgi:hypothetical protein
LLNNTLGYETKAQGDEKKEVKILMRLSLSVSLNFLPNCAVRLAKKGDWF